MVHRSNPEISRIKHDHKNMLCYTHISKFGNGPGHSSVLTQELRFNLTLSNKIVRCQVSQFLVDSYCSKIWHSIVYDLDSITFQPSWISHGHLLAFRDVLLLLRSLVRLQVSGASHLT